MANAKVPVVVLKECSDAMANTTSYEVVGDGFKQVRSAKKWITEQGKPGVYYVGKFEERVIVSGVEVRVEEAATVDEAIDRACATDVPACQNDAVCQPQATFLNQETSAAAQVDPPIQVLVDNEHGSVTVTQAKPWPPPKYTDAEREAFLHGTPEMLAAVRERQKTTAVPVTAAESEAKNSTSGPPQGEVAPAQPEGQKTSAVSRSSDSAFDFNLW